MDNVNVDKALQTWLDSCPALDNAPLLNWLNETDGACAIVPIPAEREKEFIDPEYVPRTYDFMVQVTAQGSEVTDDVNADIMGMLRDFQNWIDDCEIEGNYPDFGQNCGCYELRNLSEAPYAAIIYDTGIMQMQCSVRLQYLEERIIK